MLEQAGGTIPAYCSALGRAILAFSEPATVQAVLQAGLPARTPRTLTNPLAVLRELTAVPDQGWATEREEGNIGVSCVAAPVFGPLGEVVAAMSVTGPSKIIRADRIGPAVRLAAAAASRAYARSR
jgi:DNA-binding IclR family transcriptional regulator